MAKNKSTNWFIRHKILTVLLALIVLGIIGSALGGSTPKSSSPSGTSATQTTKNKTYRFAERADKQPTDVEVIVGEPANINGLQMTVTSAQYKQTLGEFDSAPTGQTYLVAAVHLENTGKDTKPYNEADFRIQTTSGQVLDSTFSTYVTNALNSGDLVSGGKVDGNIVFKIPQETTHQYIIWKPGLDPDRAIVQVQ